MVFCTEFWMDGGGLESRCVYGADGVVARHHPHRTHDLHTGSQDHHHPSKNSVHKTICCNSTSDAPDDGHVPETCRAENTSIKLPCCIKLAFHIISWGRCTVKQPSSFLLYFWRSCVTVSIVMSIKKKLYHGNTKMRFMFWCTTYFAASNTEHN